MGACHGWRVKVQVFLFECVSRFAIYIIVNVGMLSNMGRLLTTAQAAEYLGMSRAFLERDRWAGAKIPFIKVGSRAVRYRIEDLDAYIEKQTRVNTVAQ